MVSAPDAAAEDAASVVRSSGVTAEFTREKYGPPESSGSGSEPDALRRIINPAAKYRSG